MQKERLHCESGFELIAIAGSIRLAPPSSVDVNGRK